MAKPRDESANYDGFARYYDLVMGDRVPFIAFYGGLLGPEVRSVLDIGCGSGFVTTALYRARPDLRVVGMDGSSAMLDQARTREPGIDWVLGDLRSPQVMGHYDLVISTYNTLQHVDGAGLRQALTAMRGLLAPDGRIAFDIYRPNLSYISIPQRDRLAFRIDDNGRSLEVRENTDFDEASGVLTIDWRLIDSAESGGKALAHAKYRMWQHPPGSVEAAISAAGLSIAERYGDLDRSPYTDMSKKQVIVCVAA